MELALNYETRASYNNQHRIHFGHGVTWRKCIQFHLQEEVIFKILHENYSKYAIRGVLFSKKWLLLENKKEGAFLVQKMCHPSRAIVERGFCSIIFLRQRLSLLCSFYFVLSVLSLVDFVLTLWHLIIKKTSN